VIEAAVSLKGVTWDHPRGYDPLVACTRIWCGESGIDIAWDRRSLQDFESLAVEELARRYDLMVIDHPHIGEAVAAGCLVLLDGGNRTSEATALAAESVGPSYRSYAWQGRQWALPIDAAAQVQAWRPDLIELPLSRWSEVVALARRHLVVCPLRPPHSLMTFFTLVNNLGQPCAVDGPALIEARAGREAVEMMRELIDAIGPASFVLDPIAALEAMAREEPAIACAPWIYGYVSYARAGFRTRRVHFANVPSLGGDGPAGSVLGGAGIAVSAFSGHAAAATSFAYWVVSGAVQAGPYAAAGGQPAHDAAWRDPDVNRPAADFYTATRATLDGAWVRPRHNGYMAFQQRASERLNDGLASGESAQQIVSALNALFRACLAEDVVAQDA
jgi:multiple sugar transport system substrate-binding protein